MKARDSEEGNGILVIGLGEVGRPIYEILSEKFSNVYGYDLDSSKTVNSIDDVELPVGILHITYPFKELNQFVDTTLSYINMLAPSLVIVHSTVALGTTRTLQSRTKAKVAYSPVRGKHPLMKDHIVFWSKWVAAVDSVALNHAKDHLERAGFRVRVSQEPESLELAKLWETVYRAIMITSWHEVHRIAMRFGADVDVIAEFVSEVHEVLKDRPIYYPDVIGGHCLIQNTEILFKQTGSRLLDFVLESNKKRVEEVADDKVLEGIEKLKKVWLRYAPRSYYKL
ncbi:MAG: GDP-mannose dehydrogenase [Nitrososphaerota archaeon]|nr:GDP-mannose dehydrogenase [Aigarchaeota archaeon]MDW8076715.1 GDP-mannose dehydrogenase [Nitrososphaerota archaeon]